MMADALDVAHEGLAEFGAPAASLLEFLGVVDLDVVL